ncbi:MAG: amidohydrolase [Candidatus Krumholzibacteria bacterium]|nr:amidohydrolase [Candidatus Krumholzibacteria bacterium]
MRLYVWICTVAWIAISCGAIPTATADAVFHGGTIYTIAEGNPTVEAVVVEGDRIVYAGSLTEARRHAGEGARWIDLDGKTMIPGLVDAHAHLKGIGKYLAQLKLKNASGPAEVRAIVMKATADTPPDRWIQGRGWDQNDWDVKEFPTWQDLGGTESHPVYLRRVGGHAGWVNKKALELCGITRDTPDPEGGKIIRDEQGEPTGIFIDNAKDLITNYIPDPSPHETDDWMGAAIRHCNERGLTGMHVAGIQEEDLACFERLHGRGELTFRVYCMLSTDDKDLEFTEQQLKKGPHATAGGKVVVRAVKLYADGALGSGGAALLAPYSDDPDNTGLLVETPEELARLARLAAESGFQVCTHAIGDRGNRVILDVYEGVLGSDGSDRRFRIEHAQVVALEDIARFKELGVIPSMQPTHCTSDMYWAEDRVEPERIKGAYAWRRFLDDGNPLPLGSDAPVESVDPLWGIYAAVTRQDHDNWPDGGWYADQRMTVLEALRGFTIDAAYAAFAEDDAGTIEAGKLADFTILDRDILHIAPRELLDTRVTHTVVGGEIVFSSSH